MPAWSAPPTGGDDYDDRLREIDVFEEQALHDPRGVTIGIEGDPQRVTAMIARPSIPAGRAARTDPLVALAD